MFGNPFSIQISGFEHLRRKLLFFIEGVQFWTVVREAVSKTNKPSSLNHRCEIGRWNFPALKD